MIIVHEEVAAYEYLISRVIYVKHPCMPVFRMDDRGLKGYRTAQEFYRTEGCISLSGSEYLICRRELTRRSGSKRSISKN